MIRLPRTFAGLALLLGAHAPALPAAPAAAPAFQPRDAFSLAWAQDVAISPDGRTLAYVRYTQDIMLDRATTQVWLVELASGRQWPLGAAGSRSPHWSPDGTRLAYLAGQGEQPAQLQVRDIAGGATRELTSGAETPGDLSWSPQGDRIAFSRFVPDPEPARPALTPVARPDGARWAAPVRIVERADYRADGEGLRRAGRQRLFVVDAGGGQARQLSSGDFDDRGPLAWSPDGRRLAFASNHAADRDRDLYETEIFSLDLQSGALVQLTHRRGPDSAPAFSPDGRLIAFVGYDDRIQGHQNRQLSVMDADGGHMRVLSADLDRDVDLPAWSADGRALYFSYVDQGSARIARTTLDGHRRVLASGPKSGELDRPNGDGSGYSLARDGTLAFAGNPGPLPPEVMVVGRDGRARVLTALNHVLFAGRTLAALRPLPVASSADGRPIGAWMLTPPGYVPGRRYPTILEIHGGPYSAYGPAWSTAYQLYAQAGYVVVYGNPRGSTSYGEAFANLIHYDFPSRDYDDLMSIVDAAIAAGVADPDNLFVTGGSGGGLLTAWIVGSTDRFRAAVSQKPVINWSSELLTTDLYAFMSKYWFRAMPWDDPDTYWRQSPLSRVGRIATPTAVIVGEDDARTPPAEGEQLYNALTLRGVPTLMVRVPDASHGSLADRPSQFIAQIAATLDWFGRYRQPPPATR